MMGFTVKLTSLEEKNVVLGSLTRSQQIFEIKQRLDRLNILI